MSNFPKTQSLERDLEHNVVYLDLVILGLHLAVHDLDLTVDSILDGLQALRDDLLPTLYRHNDVLAVAQL